jgi:hypothetical protein
MFFKRLGIAAAVLVGVGATGRELAAYQGPGDAATSRPSAPAASSPRLSPQAAAIYRYVKQRQPGELNWQRTPWLSDLPDAIRQARAENRPLLLWITADEPLDRC